MDGVQHTGQRLFVFYLVPEFTMLAFSSAVEVLRLANAALGYEAYAWRLTSADGGKVRASCGLAVETDGPIALERLNLAGGRCPHMAVVCSGQHVERHPDRAADAWLRECRQRRVAVASLCTGAHVLARAGLLDDRKCAIHWEDFPGFAERFSDARVNMSIYEIDGDIHSCAGGTAAFDMMLHIVRRDFGEAVAAGVCELALVDHTRDPGERQRVPFAQRVGTRHPVVLRLVQKMEDTLTEPLRMDELAAGMGLTRRQIERLFRSELHCSPARYYVKLRLERARLLLMQTSIPVVEVAVASGFVSASHFSKCYREAYGCSPQETRAPKAKASAQPRQSVGWMGTRSHAMMDAAA